jgi:hypothetical protein
MRHIRFSLLTALFVLFTFSIVTYTSCKEDKCKNIVCANGGSCAEGKCVCPTGYTGTVCENAPVVDPCANVICQNGGTCSNGNCTCATGYEGTNCQTLSRAKFIGTYVGTEQCTMGTDAYSLVLSAHTDNMKLTLTNLYNQGFTATCTITGTNTFTFSGTDGSATYSGAGTFSNNQITINYQISDIGGSNACTFTGVK